MTTKREYLCNLCRDSIGAFAGMVVTNGERTGVGCYFSGNDHTFVHMRDAENHLCQRCIENICENAKTMGLGQ